jgi:hypothetical protein
MRNRSLGVTIAFLTAISVINVWAQPSTRPLKFDEFSGAPNSTSSPLIERGNRLARWLEKAPKDTSVIIIYYDPRKRTYPTKYGAEWAEYTKGILVNGYKYWIVRPTSAAPTATPTFDASEIVYCPEIDLASDGFNFDQSRPLKFSASVKGGDPAAKLTFRWNVSAGRIIDGQGTNSIKVVLTISEAKRVTASVLLDGLSPECDPYRWTATELGRRPFKFAEIHYNYSYFIALLDSMFSTLSTDPRLRGYVIMYGHRSGSKGELDVRLKAAQQYVLFRRFDNTRIDIVSGGYREVPSVELYILPEGVQPPATMPSFDEQFLEPVKTRRAKTPKHM